MHLVEVSHLQINKQISTQIPSPIYPQNQAKLLSRDEVQLIKETMQQADRSRPLLRPGRLRLRVHPGLRRRLRTVRDAEKAQTAGEASDASGADAFET